MGGGGGGGFQCGWDVKGGMGHTIRLNMQTFLTSDILPVCYALYLQRKEFAVTWIESTKVVFHSFVWLERNIRVLCLAILCQLLLNCKTIILRYLMVKNLCQKIQSKKIAYSLRECTQFYSPGSIITQSCRLGFSEIKEFHVFCSE